MKTIPLRPNWRLVGCAWFATSLSLKLKFDHACIIPICRPSEQQEVNSCETEEDVTTARMEYNDRYSVKVILRTNSEPHDPIMCSSRDGAVGSAQGP